MNFSKKLPPMPNRLIPRIPSAIQRELNKDNKLIQVIPKPLSRQSMQFIDYQNQQLAQNRYIKLSVQKVQRCRSSKNISSSKSISSEKSIQKLAKHLISGRQIANLPYITAKSWSIFQISTNKFIYGKKQDIKREVASLTKIANLITILEILAENTLDPQKIFVKITRQAASMIGTTAMLKQGMIISLKDLFYGMMLPSGNDAAYQIAQVGGAIINLLKQNENIINLVYDKNFLAYAVDKFKNNVLVYLNRMNLIAKNKAKTISTSFANPHGLSNVKSLSTAEDMAKLSAYSMRNQRFREVVETKSYSCKYQGQIVTEEILQNEQNIDPNLININLTNPKSDQKKEKIISWQNTNKMLWRGFSGIKTGITPNAGPCLSASIKKTINQKEYQFVIILLKSFSMQTRWKQVQGLAIWAQQLMKQ